MKYSVLSVISIGIGFMTLQACSHAPVPYEPSSNVLVPTEISKQDRENGVLGENGNMKKTEWLCR